MAAKSLRCRECEAEYELEAKYVCERCFGPLEVSYERPEILDVDGLRRRIQAGPQNIWRYADFLPLAAPPGPSARLASRAGLPAGCTPLVRADRLAERLGLREVWVKNDSANPTHSFKDRVVTVAAARARELGFETLACASTGNLANATAATGAALGLETYVFIPSDLEEQKILATGVYGTNLVKVRGNYDDVNRLCTELSGERDWAFVNVNMRPYYAEGSKTRRVRGRRAARVAHAGPRRRADRLRLAVHEDRQGLPGVLRPRAHRGRPAPDERRAGDGLHAGRDRVRRGPGLLPPRPPDGHRQVAGDRLPADGPYALDAARKSGGGIDAVDDDEIRAGIRLLAETTGIFTETAGGVTTATLAKLAARGDIAPDERVVLVITGDGLKTLDAVRDTFTAHEIDASFDQFVEQVEGGVRV